jgi:carbon monoxide dehydrogenase subunit G
MRIESSIVVQAPAAKIFDFIADIQRQPEWIGAVAAVRNISTTPAQLGTTFDLSLSLMGKSAEASQEVTRFEPGRAFSQQTTSGPIPTEITLTLNESGGVTTVQNVTEADISSLGRFAGPLVGRTIRRQLETDLNTLRDIMEQEQ